MNVFFIDRDPRVAARGLVDSHVNKMITESAQLLSTAHRVLDGVERIVLRPRKNDPDKLYRVHVWKLSDGRDNILYQSTHINHPSAKWVRQSTQHYIWLLQHLDEMFKEYTRRWGRYREAQTTILPVLNILPNNLNDTGFSDPPCAMPVEYITSNDAVVNYRNYYRLGKQNIHKWKLGDPPNWINGVINE